MPNTTFALQTPSGQSAVGSTLPLPESGVALTLQVPAVAPARLELASAQLTLEGAGDPYSVSPGSAGVAFADEKGTAITTSAVTAQRITVDWQARRALLSVQLTTALGTNETAKARLKIFDEGHWLPPVPVDIIAVGVAQTLPDTVGSKLLIELVTVDANGVVKPTSLALTGISLTFASQPYDLSVSVAGQPPFFTRPGRLPGGQQVTLQPELLAALAPALPKDGAAASVPVTLDDAMQGSVKVAGFQLSAKAVFTGFDGAPPAGLALPWRGEAAGTVAIGATAVLDEVRFTLAPELIPERLAADVSPAATFAYAQLCDPTHSAAQGFTALPGALAGIDLWLGPTREKVVGALALHPDVQGLPGPVPFTGTEMPFELADLSRPAPLRWVRFQLPKPLDLSADPWWVVLTMSEGELFWPLGTSAPPRVRPIPRQRLGQGVWTPWSPPPAAAQAPWGLCRLRAAATTPPPTFTVELRRGTDRVSMVTAGGVPVSVPPTLLASLKSGPSLTVAVSSPQLPVTGTLRFTDLRIAVHNP